MWEQRRVLFSIPSPFRPKHYSSQQLPDAAQFPPTICNIWEFILLHILQFWLEKTYRTWTAFLGTFIIAKALFFRTCLGTFKSPHTFIRTKFCPFFALFSVAPFWALFCGFCLVLFWELLIANKNCTFNRTFWGKSTFYSSKKSTFFRTFVSSEPYSNIYINREI